MVGQLTISRWCWCSAQKGWWWDDELILWIPKYGPRKQCGPTLTRLPLDSGMCGGPSKVKALCQVGLHNYFSCFYCRLFKSNGRGRMFGAKCNSGDRVGCGIKFEQVYDDSSPKQMVPVFFTRNGKEVWKLQCFIIVDKKYCHKQLSSRLLTIHHEAKWA